MRREGMRYTAKFGIDPMPNKYRASIANTNTDTFYLEKQLILYFKGKQCLIIYEVNVGYHKYARMKIEHLYFHDH